MNTEELIKELNGIMSGEGEFPLPDTMIDDIIEKLKDGEELKELHDSYIDIVLDLYDQLEQKNKMTVGRIKYWVDILSRNPKDHQFILEGIIKEVGGEVVEK